MKKRTKLAAVAGSAALLLGAGLGSGLALASSTITSPVSVFTPITPVRVLDTRTSSGAVAANGSVTFIPSNVPSGATGVALNITAVAPTKGGDLVVDPDGVGGPTGTSNANFVANTNTANGVTTQLGADGGVTVYNQSAGTVQLVVDLDGYYTPGSGAAGPQGPAGPAGPTGPSGAGSVTTLTGTITESQMTNNQGVEYDYVVNCPANSFALTAAQTANPTDGNVTIMIRQVTNIATGLPTQATVIDYSTSDTQSISYEVVCVHL